MLMFLTCKRSGDYSMSKDSGCFSSYKNYPKIGIFMPIWQKMMGMIFMVMDRIIMTKDNAWFSRYNWHKIIICQKIWGGSHIISIFDKICGVILMRNYRCQKIYGDSHYFYKWNYSVLKIVSLSSDSILADFWCCREGDDKTLGGILDSAWLIRNALIYCFLMDISMAW